MITKIVIGFRWLWVGWGIGFGRFDRRVVVTDAGAVELSAVVVGLSQNSRTGSSSPPRVERDQYTLVDAFKQMVAA